jgi:hypothetical protein
MFSYFASNAAPATSSSSSTTNDDKDSSVDVEESQSFNRRILAGRGCRDLI